MLTAVNCRQKKMALIPVLSQLGFTDTSALDWHNKMLGIHMLQKALESTGDAKDDLRHTIMMTLACCYEDRGSFDESLYWYQKCMRDCRDDIPLLQKLHARGSLLLNLIHTGNMPDAEDLLRELLAEPPDPREAEAPVFYDHAQALRLYFEARVLSMEDDADTEEIRSTIDTLMEICDGYGKYLLMQKIRCGALEIMARQSRRDGDKEGAITLFKRAAAAALGYGAKNKAAACRREISAIYEEMGDHRQAWHQYRKYYRMSQRLYRKRSEEFSAYLLAKNNLSETERELNNLWEMKEYLSVRRNTDPLTGVFNRRFWDESLAEKAAASGPDSVVSVLMLDIDSFKEYNDTYGHLEGDRALKAIGGLLGDCVRRDTDVLARFGGDEFVILADGMGERESEALAGRILACIREYPFNGGHICLKLSIGISSGSVMEKHCFADMLAEADEALYYSKQHGKDRYTHIRDIKGDRHDRQA